MEQLEAREIPPDARSASTFLLLILLVFDIALLAADVVAGLPRGALFASVLRLAILALCLILLQRRRAVAYAAPVAFAALLAQQFAAGVLTDARAQPHAFFLVTALVCIAAAAILPWGWRWQAALAAINTILLVAIDSVSPESSFDLFLTINVVTVVVLSIALAAYQNSLRLELSTEIERSDRARRRANALASRLGESVRARTAELQQSARELGRLCSAGSHDLRPSLRRIAGFSQLLEESVPNGTRRLVSPLLSPVVETARRTGETIDLLLADVRRVQYRLARNLLSLGDIAAAELREATHGQTSTTYEIDDDTLQLAVPPTVAAVVRDILRLVVRASVELEIRRVELGRIDGSIGIRLPGVALDGATRDLWRSALRGAKSDAATAAGLTQLASSARTCERAHGRAVELTVTAGPHAATTLRIPLEDRRAAARPALRARTPQDPREIDARSAALLLRRRVRVFLGFLFVQAVVNSAGNLYTSREHLSLLAALDASFIGSVFLLFAAVSRLEDQLRLEGVATFVQCTALLAGSASAMLVESPETAATVLAAVPVLAATLVPLSWRAQSVAVAAGFASLAGIANFAHAGSFPLQLRVQVGGCLLVSYYFAARTSRWNRELLYYSARVERSLARIASLNAVLERRLRDREALLHHAHRRLERFCVTLDAELRPRLKAMSEGLAAADRTLRSQEPAASTALVERALAAVVRMGETLSLLLEYIELGRCPIEQRDVDLAGIARSCLLRCRSSDPERRAEVRIPDSLDVYGDPRLLSDAMEALLTNAWKFTSHREVAHIEVRSRTMEDGFVEITVQDDGSGFDMSHARKIFQPFSKLEDDESSAGHGMGLARVARIVARHGGYVRGAGFPERGAEFTLALPIRRRTDEALRLDRDQASGAQAEPVSARTL